jgi:hypothetical protein
VETHLAHEIGQALADWYEENGLEGDSAQIDLSLNAWQTLRDAKHDLPPADPTAAISRRRSLPLTLRPKFRKTEPGTAFAKA